MPSKLLHLLLLLPLLWTLHGCSPRLAAPEPTVEDLLQAAKSIYEKGKYYEAKEKFESIRFDYPGNPYIGEVQFYIGLCYFRIREFLNAEQEFRAFIREFPLDNPFADDARYWLCKTLFEDALPARLDQATTRKCIEEIDDFTETFPRSEYMAEIKALRDHGRDRLAEKEFLSGRLYRRMGYTSAAVHYFHLLEKEYSDTRWIARGRYEWARCLYIQKNYIEAGHIADTCAAMLDDLKNRRKDGLVRAEPFGAAYKFFHFYGLVPYETRSEIKIYIDDLEKDLATLRRKIERKIAKVAAQPAPAPAS